MKLNVVYQNSRPFKLKQKECEKEEEKDEDLDERMLKLMCLKQNVFLDLCNLYPESCEMLKQVAIYRRSIFLHYMKKVKQV